MSVPARVTAKSSKCTSRTKRARVTVGAQTAIAKRAALIERLRKKAADADAGGTVDTVGMSDDQFIANLRRR